MHSYIAESSRLKGPSICDVNAGNSISNLCTTASMFGKARREVVIKGLENVEYGSSPAENSSPSLLREDFLQTGGRASEAMIPVILWSSLAAPSLALWQAKASELGRREKLCKHEKITGRARTRVSGWHGRACQSELVGQFQCFHSKV